MKVEAKIFDCANFNEDEVNEFLHGAIHVETFTRQVIGDNPVDRDLVKLVGERMQQRLEEYITTQLSSPIQDWTGRGIDNFNYSIVNVGCCS
jgi:hypothetical protein